MRKLSVLLEYVCSIVIRDEKCKNLLASNHERRINNVLAVRCNILYYLAGTVARVYQRRFAVGVNNASRTQANQTIVGLHAQARCGL